jgi:hypothetical protein
MNEYLTRTVRELPDGMGGEVTYYNNLYFVPGNGIVQGRTEDGMYIIYSWQALEVDPRTGLSRTYDQYTLTDAGVPLGLIDDNVSFTAGVVAKVELIVPTSPGAEVTP